MPPLGGFTLKEIIMFTIYVRNNGYNHDFKTESVFDAHVLFNALTETFSHVEMWKGMELVIKYDNR